MTRRSLPFVFSFAYLLLASTSGLLAQHYQFASIPDLPFDHTLPAIRAHAEPFKPFTVAGERGVVLGQQDGTFEAWVLPVKLLSHMTIEAEVQGYSVPINVNEQAAEVEVRPDRTIITYSHVAYTVRQIMFSPNAAEAGTGPVVLYEFDCLHPTDFTFRFTPDMLWMWPERNEGIPDAEWVHGPGQSGGFYVLHSDYPDFAGALTIPGAEPGILAPYQERPQVHPVELKLHIDPARDHGRLFPLLMTVGATKEAANTASLAATLEKLNQSIAAEYASHVEGYKTLLADSVALVTPDKALDEAFQWAVTSIEQLKTHVPQPRLPDAAPSPEETALVAGYYASADSARPGFGWFFGRDSLYTLYAVNGYGDFALSKDELAFLIRRQRDDGKIMHEYSQTAADIDWKSFPYMYAAADATPLFLLAMEDYVRASGDTSFIRDNRDAIEKAWTFETTHDADGDGIYDNSQGTGWVESWPGHMPHQEIYLALLDQQASGAMADLEKLLGSADKAASAQQRADKVAKTIESEYYDAAKSCYSFSRNTDGTLDQASTVYPALAWWSEKAIPGENALAHPGPCLEQMAAHTLNTDWGLRDVSTDEKFYDGMSYHQGSVWPLFTGWAALAEYRGGQPLAGYRMLMENANLTWAQDLGADTELLSGDFYTPFGRSTSHQLWSSAMVITPALRGLFGIAIDAQTKTITVNPHLPAGWDHADVKNLRVGDATVDLAFVQDDGKLEVTTKASGKSEIKLRSELAGAKASGGNTVIVPRPEVEVGAMFEKPVPGDRTKLFRVLSEQHEAHKTTLVVEGMAGTNAEMPVFVHAPKVRVRAEGASLTEVPDAGPTGSAAQMLHISFPAGEGWKTVTAILAW